MDLSVEQIKQLIALIPLFPLLGAAVNGCFGHRLPRTLVSFIACATVLLSFGCAATAFTFLCNESAPAVSTTLFTWMNTGAVALDVRFAVDHLSGIMICVVTGVGFLIHLYSVGYMSHEPALARYFAYLNLFTFAMLVLVLGDSLPVMFVGWEGVGLCSYLLIGFWYTDNDKASAGKKAFVVNRIGDFGFLCAMMILLRYVGDLNFPGLAAAAAAGQISTGVATAACLLLVLGATGKSAQIPLYTWLPDAMAGPTPVSALIHAATMVTAGLYLTARLSFLFHLAPLAMLTLASIGAVTALFAASIGTAQNDIKKVLAYSTVSQLGFMFIAAGVGAYAMALFHVVTHAFFKACLFLGAGSVIHGMGGEQDMRQMGGLWRKMPVTFATFFVATLAITGFPFLSGFISKDAILWHAFNAGEGPYAEVFGLWGKGFWALGLLAAGFTSFYMWRLVFLTFFSGRLRAPADVRHRVHESSATMTVPLIILAALAVGAGAIGWPPALGGSEWIARWLQPVVGPLPELAGGGEHLGLELGLMGISTAVAGAGFVVAYLLYARTVHPLTHRFASESPWSWWYERVLHKWHVDELYDAVVVRPTLWVSRVVLYEIFDRLVIDKVVNGVGWFARSVGFLGQLFQSGNIQRYLAIFAMGLAVLLYGWLTPGSARPAFGAGDEAPAIEMRAGEE